MAPPNSKNNRKDAVSETSSNLSTGSDISYDGGSSSAFSTDSMRSPRRRSRLDSFLSSGSSRSNSRRRSSGSHSSQRSARSSGSGSSLKSILKKKSSPRKRRSLSVKKASKSPKRADVRPIGQVSMIKNPAIRAQVRGFVSEYAKDPEFEAFALSVDGIPFVALSLMNADPELIKRFQKVQPPTPMKKHTPGLNSPRKRPLQRKPRSSSVNSKCVRFTDEGSSAKKSRRSSSTDSGDFRCLGETVSEAMVETDRQYNDLWNDRTNSVEK